MPSYALNQFLDLEEVMCKQLLSLDLRDPSQTSALPLRPVGYQRSCSLSASSSALSSDSTESATMNSSNWGQQAEASLPSRWNKMSFWAERSVSMVETNDTGSLGWASPESKQSPATPPNGSPISSSSTSTRYKTEMCRTFAESGICKYGGKCQFAHGPDEIRDLNRHPKYKTEPCRTFHTIGFCPYGIRCHFVHNNEDDLGPGAAAGRPGPQQPPRTRPRPPLLKQSFSFAGFPSAPPPPPLGPSLPHPFLRVPSVSPPASADFTDLLGHPFPEVDSPRPQFLPSPDSGCSLCGMSPVPSPCQSTGVFSEGCGLLQSPPSGPTLGSRSLSYTSLSDHEGGCGSSASSLSGSDSSGTDASGRRLPIFSQLSVPDEGFSSEGCSGSSFFL